MFKINPLNLIDFYKADHRTQYPNDTEYVYSNWTPRSNKTFKATWPKHDGKVVAFGIESSIQHWIKDYFDKEFFTKKKDRVISEYKTLVEGALGPGAITYEHVSALHDLGFLPIRIKALPEGSTVKVGVPYVTIINTLPEFFWLTNYLETLLSSVLWKPATVATIAREYYKLIKKYADNTGCSSSPLTIQAHDFSFRGLGSPLEAAMAQMGHLVYFDGTDTVPAIQAAQYFHDSPAGVGVSVPATEHSVMCMGSKEKEIKTFERLLNLYPSGVVSIVSDTWDFWKVLTSYTVLLKEKILSRSDVVDENGDLLVPGKTVFRPDSGDPVKILTGYMDNEYEIVGGKYFCLETGKELGEYEVKGAVEVLYDIFGGEKNEAGFIELNPRVGLIYGDSITLNRCDKILARLEHKGFASSNVVFGIGSFTYQYLTRDVFGFAMKATWGQRGGTPVEIYKDPITDDGTKTSAKGLIRVVKGTLHDQQLTDEGGDLEVIFENGKMLRKTDFNTIRERATR